jgi:RNA polymerase sigma-70 factor (ECF subfamily)
VNAGWECFSRAQRGDEAAWRELIENYSRRLGSLALLITGSAVAAEDIVQETFVRAFGARVKHYRGTVGTFLGTIAYRLSLKEKKLNKRSEELDNERLPDQHADSLANMLQDERDKHIAAAIRALDRKHRDILILRFYADCSYEEIAGIMQLSLGTVKSRIFYAVKTCREILKEKGILE